METCRLQAIIGTHAEKKCESDPTNKLQWIVNQNLYIFIEENTFENIVWKMAAILSRSQCDNNSSSVHENVTTIVKNKSHHGSKHP